MLKAFTYRVTDEEEKAVVHRILQAAFPDVPHEVYPIPQYSPSHILDDGDAVITFGATAAMAVQDYKKAIQLLTLPAPKNLLDKPANGQSREQAWEMIQKFAESINQKAISPTKIEITEADMPDLDAKHLLVLERLIERSGSQVCFQASKNGKTIAICYTNNIDQVEADVKITFEELYTVRNVMDILGVDKVELVNLK